MHTLNKKKKMFIQIIIYLCWHIYYSMYSEGIKLCIFNDYYHICILILYKEEKKHFFFFVIFLVVCYSKTLYTDWQTYCCKFNNRNTCLFNILSLFLFIHTSLKVSIRIWSKINSSKNIGTSRNWKTNHDWMIINT